MDGDKSSPAPATAVVHPAVEPLSFILGTWRGQGEGGFPTINSFSYGEELHFSHPGNKVCVNKPTISEILRFSLLDEELNCCCLFVDFCLR